MTNVSAGCKASENYSNKYPARKLTADQYPAIINNAYFKPSYRSPYYTVLTSREDTISLDTIIDPCNVRDTSATLDAIIDPCDIILNENTQYYLDIKCGNSTKQTPSVAYVEYLRVPKKVILNEDQLYGVDTTEKMEFSDYVCYEIINEFVKLLLENTADPRLSTNVPINQTVIPQITE